MNTETASTASTEAAPLAPAAAAPSAPPPLSFPRHPGETPRAYGAFLAFLQLPHPRSLQDLADNLGQNLGTIKNWSSRFNWNHRLHQFQSGLLQQHARDCAENQRLQTADWARRLEEFREQQWEVSQKLNAAALCFLESFGDDDLQRMTLAQVSRAARIASAMARAALQGFEPQPAAGPDLAPVQQQLLDAMHRVYSQAAPAPLSQPLSSTLSSTLSETLSQTASQTSS